ncbi:unnamed protein product [Closterium sp. Naga37s-1]|nr:unnamed protein product [Closterium sp. Naga37s-1]
MGSRACFNRELAPAEHAGSGSSRPPNGMRGGEREGEGEEGREGEEEFAEMGEGDEELVEIDSGGGQDGVRRKGGGAGKGQRERDAAAGGIGSWDELRGLAGQVVFTRFLCRFPFPSTTRPRLIHFPSTPPCRCCPVRPSDDDVLSADFDDDDDAPAELADDGMGQEEGEEDEEGGQDDSVHVFTAHTDSVYAVACSPLPGGRVASGGGDEVAYLWTIGQAEDPVKLQGHRDSIAAVEFSGDGRWVATAGLDGVVMLWDAATGDRRHRLEGPGEGIEVRGPVCVCRWETHVLLTAAAPCGWVWHGALSHRPLLSPAAHWPPLLPQCAVLPPVPASPVPCPVPDVASTGSGGTGGVGGSDSVDVECGDGGVHGRLHGSQRGGHLWGLLPRCGAVWIGKADGSVRLLSRLKVPSSTPTHRSPSPRNPAPPLLPHPSGRAVWTGSTDGSVRCWDPRSAATTATLAGPLFHSDAITCVAMAPQGSVGAAGSSDHTTALFGLQQPKVGLLSCPPLHVMPHAASTAVSLLSHSRTDLPLHLSRSALVTATHLPTSSAKGTSHITLVSQQSSVSWLCAWHLGTCMAWHGMGAGRGPTVATASLDGSVRIFDINSLQLRSTCSHQDGVVQMAWAPAAPVLVTATADGAVHVWDARTGAIQKTLRGNRDAVLSLALTPDAFIPHSHHTPLHATSPARTPSPLPATCPTARPTTPCSDGVFAVTGSDDHTARVFQL